MDWFRYPILAENDYAESWKGPGTDTPHFAADVQTPVGTPVTSLFAGRVTQADYAPWGGEVFISTTYHAPGFHPNLEWYVYHLDKVTVKKGDTVNAGDVIGLSGGEPPVTQPKYSTGPHTHTGFFDPQYSGHTQNPPYYPVDHGWATIPAEGGVPQHKITYGPDVTPVLTTAQATGLTSDPGTALANAANYFTGNQVIDTILSRLGVSSVNDLLYRALFIGIGLVLLIVGLVLLGKSLISQTVSGALQHV